MISLNFIPIQILFILALSWTNEFFGKQLFLKFGKRGSNL